MGQQVNLSSKLNSNQKQVQRNRVLNIRFKLLKLDPKPNDLTMNKLFYYIYNIQTEPKYVAKCWDNLWLGVKG